MNSKYALHEVLEVHEIAAFKTVCMTKSKTMQALVTDPELKQISTRCDIITTAASGAWWSAD